MAIIGTLATVLAQLSDHPAFDGVRAYLEELRDSGSAARGRLEQVAAGETKRIELAQGAFALEQAYLAKPRTEGFFEAHARYIDVQVVVAGQEVMEVADAAHMTVERPLDAERDLIVYRDRAGASQLRLGAGDAAVFFPADVHMPGLRGAAGATLVRKSVVKVPVPAAVETTPPRHRDVPSTNLGPGAAARE